MTQSYISCKHDIPVVSLLVASARTRYAGLLRGKGEREEVEKEATVHYALCTGNAPLAQLVEQLTLNQWVPGSSP